MDTAIDAWDSGIELYSHHLNIKTDNEKKALKKSLKHQRDRIIKFLRV